MRHTFHIAIKIWRGPVLTFSMVSLKIIYIFLCYTQTHVFQVTLIIEQEFRRIKEALGQAQ